MKSFATIVENDITAIDADEGDDEDIEVDSTVVRQMSELKKKIGKLMNNNNLLNRAWGGMRVVINKFWTLL